MAIIAILASLMFPALSKALRKARGVSGHLGSPSGIEMRIDEVVAKSNAIAAKPVRPALLPRASSDSERLSAERLNMVLDKISKHGIESLTSEELRVLEEMSRKLRNDQSQ